MNGPYCPSCGTCLGRWYKEGDECLECWEERQEKAAAEWERGSKEPAAKPLSREDA